MSHTYTSIYLHYIFSTQHREKVIKKELQQRLWPYMGGIARENNMKALAIGGIEDHVHVFLSLPATFSASRAIKLIKGSSSKWVHDTFPEFSHFKWQAGYGVFSVSISQIERTISYIHSQEEHHRVRTFQEEYLHILKKHGLEYDERYIWG